MRVAFCGASGTGKSTLMKLVADKYGLPINPIGSRQVAAAMGFASPYDVDNAGLRDVFQRNLLDAKYDWEHAQERFVSDRTLLDNAAYTLMHSEVDEAVEQYVGKAIVGSARYTHVFFCPLSSFQNLGDDPARKLEPEYHLAFEDKLLSLLQSAEVSYFELGAHAASLDARWEYVQSILQVR